MPKTFGKYTTAENLESRFDAGEEVLDYFDLRTAKTVLPGKRFFMSAIWEQPIEKLEEALRLKRQILALQERLSSLFGGDETDTADVGKQGNEVRSSSRNRAAAFR